MKIRLRLLLLLGALLAVFAAATGVLQESHRREAASISSGIEQQRAALLDRLISLTGQSLQTFADDYSLWDDMVTFLQTGDPTWAKINLDSSRANFAVHAIWVLRTDWSLVYRSGDDEPAMDLLFDQPAFREAVRGKRKMHFYLETAGGLLEVRTAPIQPSSDLSRDTPPRGWLVVTRLWNENHLTTLADTLQSQLSFAPPDTRRSSTVSLERILPGWAGRTVRTLHATYESTALARLMEGNEDESYLFLGLGAAMIALTGLALSKWVLAPLQTLSRGLETGRPEQLRSLRDQQNEFGHLAQLAEHSVTQRQSLEREVAERTRLAESLQATSNQLRESIELRGRLARDLHDGVIQSIYAAGMGLEGVRSLLQTDPAGAERRLMACQATLNATIRDVRAFINGLEGEGRSGGSFRQTLATLVATMQAVQPGNVALEVDEAVANRLSPPQELQVLNILRESISNALRHADPRTIRLSLERGAGDEAVITVVDDGCGFTPSAVAGGGRGLVNLGIRAREMGGSVDIESAPGKGTRIVLRFLPTYPP